MDGCLAREKLESGKINIVNAKLEMVVREQEEKIQYLEEKEAEREQYDLRPLKG